MPGAEESLTWKLIPIECGHVRLPRIRVTNRRKPMTSEVDGLSDAETVKIIDVRMRQQHRTDLSQQEQEQQDDLGTILVLPY